MRLSGWTKVFVMQSWNLSTRSGGRAQSHSRLERAVQSSCVEQDHRCFGAVSAQETGFVEQLRPQKFHDLKLKISRQEWFEPPEALIAHAVFSAVRLLQLKPSFCPSSKYSLTEGYTKPGERECCSCVEPQAKYSDAGHHFQTDTAPA